FVILDTETTPALEAEGLARDMIRAVQDTRKQADFDVSDRIHLQLDFASDADRAAVEQAWEIAGVATETLANSSAIGEGKEGAEWLNVVNPGTYASAGDVTIAVTRQEIKCATFSAQTPSTRSCSPARVRRGSSPASTARRSCSTTSTT